MNRHDNIIIAPGLYIKAVAAGYYNYKTIMTYDIVFIALLMCFKVSIKL